MDRIFDEWIIDLNDLKRVGEKPTDHYEFFLKDYKEKEFKPIDLKTLKTKAIEFGSFDDKSCRSERFMLAYDHKIEKPGTNCLEYKIYLYVVDEAEYWFSVMDD